MGDSQIRKKGRAPAQLAGFFLELASGIGMSEHFPELNDGGKREDAADDPVQHILILIQFIDEQLPAKDENPESHQRAKSNNGDIHVVMVIAWEQYFLGK